MSDEHEDFSFALLSDKFFNMSDFTCNFFMGQPPIFLSDELLSKDPPEHKGAQMRGLEEIWSDRNMGQDRLYLSIHEEQRLFPYLTLLEKENLAVQVFGILGLEIFDRVRDEMDE